MLGTGRGFATDLRAVFLPWPLPAGFVGIRLTCAFALQAAPSKDLVAQLPVAHMSARERLALQVVEAAEAVGWALKCWPGLALALRELTGDIDPLCTANLTAAALLERAVSLADSGNPLTIPAVCGQLPLVRSGLVSLAARRAQLEARLPWANKKRLHKLNNWSVAIAGEGDAAARIMGQPDADEEEGLLDRRGASTGIPYPEWNVFAQRYREDHVRVIESRVGGDGARAVRVDPRVAVWFEQSIDRSWKHRLEDGSDVDFDSIVEACNDDLTGMGNPRHGARFYRERLRAARDTACALLIDRSGSLAQADNLHHEVACASALATAMDRARERYATFAFWSDTRHHVAVEVLRDFDDGAQMQIDLKRLAPRGYTRIGGALRHVTTRLRKQPVNRRILLVLGDAIPNDEGYEGQYAVADVAKAVEEAEQCGITIAFVAIGAPAVDPLADVLRGKFHRLSSVAELAPVLADLHARLAS